MNKPLDYLHSVLSVILMKCKYMIFPETTNIFLSPPKMHFPMMRQNLCWVNHRMLNEGILAASNVHIGCTKMHLGAAYMLAMYWLEGDKQPLILDFSTTWGFWGDSLPFFGKTETPMGNESERNRCITHRAIDASPIEQ